MRSEIKFVSRFCNFAYVFSCFSIQDSFEKTGVQYDQIHL